MEEGEMGQGVSFHYEEDEYGVI